MINLILLISAYLFMEFVAWSNHKFVMHGFLWRWHKDHHVNDQKKVAMNQVSAHGFEKNDLFFLVYALPAIGLFIAGLWMAKYSMVFIATGITLYGLTYFFIHDILIHERLKLPFLHKLQNRYTKAIINAHLAHHRPKNSIDFSNFGLLIFPKRFYNP